jgi:hypothetical protein
MGKRKKGRPRPTVLSPVSGAANLTGAAATIQATGFVYASRVQAPSRWLLRHLPKSLGWVTRLDWVFLIAFGFTMVQVDEYLVADFFWALPGLVLIAKAITWDGIEHRHKLTLLARLVLTIAAVSFCGLMIAWTNTKKADRAWSNLTSTATSGKAALPSAKKKLSGPRFPERGARIEVAKLTPVFDIPNRPLGVRIDFKNVGPIPAASIKYSMGFQLTTDQWPFPLSEQEIKNGIAGMRSAAERQPQTHNSEVQPNDGWFFIFTSPYINREIMTDLTAGKQFLYLYLVAVYKDAQLETDETTVTEFCAFFVDKFAHYKTCPTGNKIFTEQH